MAVIEKWFGCDLQEPVRTVNLNGGLFSQDNLGNKIGVTVTDGGEDVTLVGSVSGYALRADGATVIIEGAKSGNQAWVVMPESAYAVVGELKLTLKLTDDGVKTTLLQCIGYVQQTSSDTYVDPGTVVPDLSDLLAAIDDMETATAAANAAATKAVRYDETQSLTTAQKTQARANIDAVVPTVSNHTITFT